MAADPSSSWASSSTAGWAAEAKREVNETTSNSSRTSSSWAVEAKGIIPISKENKGMLQAHDHRPWSAALELGEYLPVPYHPLLNKTYQIVELRERVAAWLEANKIKYRHGDFKISIEGWRGCSLVLRLG